MTFSQWLKAAVLEHATPPLARRAHSFGGGLVATSDLPRTAGAPSLATTVSSIADQDVDARAYVPSLLSPDIGTLELSDMLPNAEAHEASRSALRLITIFPPKISHAAILLSAAFVEGAVEFRLPQLRATGRPKTTQRWYRTLVDTCLHRSREVRSALVHHWTPSGRAERLWGNAFLTLCDLTPARQELLTLFSHNRNKASVELAKHLEIVTRQFELSAYLLADIEGASEPVEEQRFAHIRETLLNRAGGGVSLTEGSELLGVTRQALHKRIKAGSALGMKDGDEIVLPRLQWVEAGDKLEFVPGLSKIVRLFKRAGGWSALQFLLDSDPNLGRPPIEAMRDGNIDATVVAAQAYLGIDEG